MKMRLVLDTDVIVAGLRSDRGASRQFILAAFDRRVVVLASVPLFLEYEAVLTRPEQLAQTGLSRGETNTILDALAAVIEPVVFRFLWKPQLKDPADEMVLGTAVNGSGRSHRDIQRKAPARGGRIFRYFRGAAKGDLGRIQETGT